MTPIYGLMTPIHESVEEVFYPYASGADFLIRRLTCAFGAEDWKSAPLMPVLLYT